ncbi:thiolase, N-terminal domain protein, partial [Vibrio parahaemolyticus V-223/04]
QWYWLIVNLAVRKTFNL